MARLSSGKVQRRIGIARTCMNLLENGPGSQASGTTRGSEPLNWIWDTEHRSFLCVEDGSLSRTLEIGNDQEEKAVKRERQRDRRLYAKLVRPFSRHASQLPHSMTAVQFTPIHLDLGDKSKAQKQKQNVATSKLGELNKFCCSLSVSIISTSWFS